MFRICLVLLFGMIPQVAVADPLNLSRVGWHSHVLKVAYLSAPERVGVGSRVPAPGKKHTAATLFDRVRNGVSFGVFKLRREGDLCLSFRKSFDQCDLSLTEDELYLFMREHDGNLPIRLNLSVRE